MIISYKRNFNLDNENVHINTSAILARDVTIPIRYCGIGSGSGIGIGWYRYWCRELLVPHFKHQYLQKPTTDSDSSIPKTFDQTLSKIVILAK